MSKVKKWILIVLSFLTCIVGIFIQPVDRTHFLETNYFQVAETALDSLRTNTKSPQTLPIEIGWAKTNITPKYLTPLSGYGSRKDAIAVGAHDSLWARGFVFKNNNEKIAFVTLDALIVPPAVTQQLVERLPSIGYDLQHLYLTATHTHSSMGAWGNSFIGKRFAGEFDPEIVYQLTSDIITVIQEAEQNVSPASIGFVEYESSDLVTNRLVGERGIIDPWFRVAKFKKQSGEIALLTTFSAHATCLSSDELKYSRDYPGQLVDSLESLAGVDFAAFAAGAVGSHRPESGGFGQHDRTRWLAASLTKKVKHSSILLKDNNPLEMVLFNVPLRNAHWRITTNWRFRPWVFQWLSEDSPHYITALRIGEIVMSGTPCDFSGELIPEIQAGLQNANIHLMVTSFNGGYVGYITKDSWYDLKEYETFIMNWFGPNNGQYFTYLIYNLVNIIS
ncbi:MAG: neutral/alkaline non-lysosomal ceramidase N-terminal domain-containing protein [Candidatus Marinimicrobia bacterium]|jgi:hypothetical protein|nr:neutral/alkaline non-lysosomal ceramidase N-terminal domain-containing protein [Candidatus Neomarinimicrobiota bacterium]MDP6201553.1 neutral/alkaline non-lysosomal ceramidase N-terminal domain-containing protein [Candidatus Neomarinimicrobiota bacterium]MDP7217654.1 neutral/alkaline non-lysosomal ceramidase N-terminal domain-containing protein [Candidatus Neomarinimicrobiota bacterium]MDP7527169.1 neutral/alkaline non-lysosomal ceramidase N-terminal domain-containing protein [Candidatus Neom|tara:strand:- start:2268 stop:3611 length:1344 start_codon:yes stop_codon:yes gene_type:complete